MPEKKKNLSKSNEDTINELEELRQKLAAFEIEQEKRKQVEEKLLESEERYQAFFQQSIEGKYRIEMDNPVDITLPIEEQIDQLYDNAYIAEYNDVFLKMYNIDSAAGLINKRIIDLHGGKYNPVNRAANRKLITSNYRLVNEETEETDINGNKIWFSNNVIGIIKKKKLICLWGTQLDITERKYAEERYKGIIQNTTNCIAVYKPVDDGQDFVFVEFNPKAEEIDKISKAEVIGKKVTEIFPGVVEFGLFKVFQDVYKSGKPEKLPVAVYKDNRIQGYRENYVYKLLSGEIVSVYKDVTKQWKKEEQIRFLSTVVKQSSDGMAIADMKGNLIFINDSWAGMHGFEKADKLIGKNLSIFHNEEQMKQDVEPFQKKVMEKGYYSAEVGHIHQDGTVFPTFMTTTLIRNENGTIIAMAGNALNITSIKQSEEERAKLKEQLVQAQKMEAIGTLAGGIAHDFNNMLGVIMGYTDLTLDDLTISKASIINLQRVMKASVRAKEMVQQILAFSRKSELIMKPVNIGKFIKETIKFLRSSIPTTIEIKYNIEKNLSLVIGNATQINQVLMNLCTNATHAMKEYGGMLEIGLKEVVLDKNSSVIVDIEPGTYQHLSVSDTGCGMNKEIKERIFEPYFTTKEVGEGTGMGLAVIYGIVKTHRGEINVFTEPGKGTVFNVYFPVLKSEKIEELETSHVNVFKGNNEMVLFVDDETTLVELCTQMLKTLGYQVDGKTSSLEALEAFKADPDKYDLVVTDMTMPNMTGVKLALEIYKIKPEIQIILCTGFSDSINKDNFKYMGISELLMKPIIKKELGEVILKVLTK